MSEKPTAQKQMVDPDKKKKALFSKKSVRMQTWYHIKDRQSQIVRYRRNLAQEHYAKNRANFNIILKSRRIGFSTEIAMSMFDDVLFGLPFRRTDGKLTTSQIDALIIAHTKEDAIKLFDDKINLAWEHHKMKTLWTVDTDRANMMKFGWGADQKTGAQRYSSIQVSNSGRSGGFHEVHISEFGKICAIYPEKAKEILRGTVPAIPDGGRLSIESTAEGATGAFHDMFWDAWNWQIANPGKKQHNRQYKAHFYNWTWDLQEIQKIKHIIPVSQMPKYFADYQKEHALNPQQLTYLFKKWEGLAKDYDGLRQEYPMTAKQAFEQSTNLFFSSQSIKAQEPHIIPNPKLQGAWRIHKEQNKLHNYVIGGDPSGGVGLDKAAAVVLDITTKPPEVVAVFENEHTDPDMFAYELKNAGIQYNMALIAVERNNHGHATLMRLREIYPESQIYREVKFGGTEHKETEKFGWNTTSSTKAQMVSQFKTALTEVDVLVRDEITLHQLSTYERDDVNTTRLKKDQKYHWDLPIALFIAYQMLSYGGSLQKPITRVASSRPSGYNKSTASFDPYAGI